MKRIYTYMCLLLLSVLSFAVTGCDDDDDDDVAKDLIELIVNKPDRKSTRLNSSHIQKSRMPSSA